MPKSIFPKLASIIVVILIVSGVGYAGLVIWIDSRIESEVPQLQPVTQELVGETKLSTEVDEIDTSAWKTYHNEEYGFEVKYPLDWKIDSSLSSKGKVVFERLLPNTPMRYEDIGVESTQLTLEEWQSQQVSASEIENISELTVDGERALRIDTGLFGRTLIITKHNGKLFYFGTYGTMISNGMLTTFRFLNGD